MPTWNICYTCSRDIELILNIDKTMSPDTISDPSSGASMDSNVASEIASLTIESVEGCENVIDGGFLLLRTLSIPKS